MTKKFQKESFTIESENMVNKIEQEIEDLEWKSFLVDAWHKPLLTCGSCMCSFHGILITIYLMEYRLS